MTLTDYLINSLFIFMVLRQAREHTLDTRSVIRTVLLMAIVSEMYLRSLPGSGNDLAFIATLAVVGTSLGALCGVATYVRADDGTARVRVGWLAGILLLFGIAARLLFMFALDHGARPYVVHFSIAHQISATAWPAALVVMALCEVATRTTVLHVRARRALTAASNGSASPTVPVPAAA
jgi:hypothetical protein